MARVGQNQGVREREGDAVNWTVYMRCRFRDFVVKAEFRAMSTNNSTQVRCLRTDEIR